MAGKNLSPANEEQAIMFLKKQKELLRQFEIRPTEVLVGMQAIIEGKISGSKKPDIIALQEKFYKAVWGIKMDFSGLEIPQEHNGCDLILCIPARKMLGDEVSLTGGKDPFKIGWRWSDKSMDDLIDHTFCRDAKGDAYIIRCRMSQEPDEELKNFSANNIAEKKINTLTFRERIILGRFLYWWKKWVLDEKYITLCAGSRYLVGNVPYVDSHDVKVHVSRCNPDHVPFLTLRARSAVLS